MAYCGNCGAGLADDVAFCGGCGIAVADLVDSPAASPFVLRTGLGLTGVVLLVLGAFAPIMGGPLGISMNLFGNGKGDGVLLMVVAAGALLLTLRRRFVWLLLTAVVATAVIVYDFVQVQNRIGAIEGLAQNFVRMEWGWAVLVLGVGLLVAAAFVRR